jgi:hypothetical protein
MAPKKSVRKWLVVGLFALGALAGAAAAVWVERTPILAWYYVRGLAQATDADRALWADRVAGLGQEGEPALFACLARPDDTACRNAGAALDRWVSRWPGDDPRAAELADRMAKAFPACSPAGRRAVLESAAGWFRPGGVRPAADLISSGARLAALSAAAAEPETHAAALDLCSLALEQTDDAQQLLPPGRDLVRKALRDEAAATRLRAIRVALHLAPHPDMDVTDDVVALLRDPAAEVRRAALLAVGPLDEKQAPAKSLLPALHDADADVRKACEEVLRKDRGLSPECVKIGWCLSHPDPVERLNVLDHLRAGADVEPGVWLRELSHDDSPAVRLAAARAMSQQDVVDLSDRLDQMASSDPSPTVCQMAKLYQKWAKAAAQGAER